VYKGPLTQQVFAVKTDASSCDAFLKSLTSFYLNTAFLEHCHAQDTAMQCNGRTCLSTLCLKKWHSGMWSICVNRPLFMFHRSPVKSPLFI